MKFDAPAPRVLLSRQAVFSAGLRLYHPDWDLETNRQTFGKAISPHGAEFQLRVDLRGLISSADGMIVNLVEVKPQLNSVVKLIEDKFLDEDIAYFGSHRPTTENIAHFLWEKFPRQIERATLHRLNLNQSKGIAAEITENSMKVSRSYEFAAAHRLYAPDLTDQENWARFDKCSNRAGHGHNFQLQVWVEGNPDANTGFIIPPSLLDKVVEEEVYARFDHKHLNRDCPEFAESGMVPTSENLALVIFDLLKQRLEKTGHVLARVGLRETQKNYFEVEA